MTDVEHGLEKTYTGHGCRCWKCTTAHWVKVTITRDWYRERGRADPTLIPHGTDNAYRNWKCRCPACTDAWAASVYEQRQRRLERPVPDHVHGTTNGYGNYGCRCDDCTDAWSADDYLRKVRRRRRDRQEATK